MLNDKAIEQVVMQGDLSKLTSEQKVFYHKAVCDSLGLNPLTKPFEYITLNGKLTLYAKKDCTDQLRKIHGINIEIVSREIIDDLYIVTAKATYKDGRFDEATGAVTISGLKGEQKANATMKAESKAKRRVTLSICGLGILDESDVQSVQSRQPSEEAFIDVLDEGHIKVLRELIADAGTTEEKMCAYLDIKDINDLTPVQWSKVCRNLDNRIQKQKKLAESPINQAFGTKEEHLAIDAKLAEEE